MGKSYRSSRRRCFLVTYSTCNGHLSRALRFAATSRPFNGPRQLGPHNRESPHVARSCGGAGREGATERVRAPGAARKTKRTP